MTTIPDFLGLGTTLVMFALVVASVMKLFQIATDVREAKDLLRDIRRNTQGSSPLASLAQASTSSLGAASYGAAVPPGVPTAEELVRAIHAQKFGDDEFPL